MKLAIWAIGAVFIFSGVVFWVMTHPNRNRAAKMETELAALDSQNDELADRNAALTRDVEALRNDPRIVARRAREIGPFAAPNEVVVQFKQDDQHRKVEVLVQVDAEEILVAGQTTEEEKLAAALTAQKTEIEYAVFVVEHQKGVDPDRLQRIKTVVDQTNATIEQ